jgi:hypothetical protein
MRNARAPKTRRPVVSVRETMTTNEASRQEGNDDESNDELPASTTRFGYYRADSIEETADYTNAMRCLSDADSALSGEYTMHSTAASQVRGAARRLNRLADSLEAEHRADTSLDFEDVSFEEYDFSESDFVAVDWSEGQGPQDEINGIVEGIHRSGGQTIVAVTDYSDENWPQGRQYDCAPEWITVVYESR